MASAIVSIAMRNHHAYAISVALLWVADIAYAMLDASPPPACSPPGSHYRTADVLLAVGWLGWLGWLILGYSVPWTAALGHSGRPVVQYANGTWFQTIGADESWVALAARAGSPSRPGY